LSRHRRGLTKHQAGALAELTKSCARDELEIRVTGAGELDGTVLAIIRDHWSVEHYRIDPYGIITRPVPAGAREVPPV
jgi:hypothetical protein